MSTEIILKTVIVLSLIGFAYYLQNYIFVNEGFRTLEVPAKAPEEFLPLMKKSLDIVPGGPSSPNAVPNVAMPSIQANDPMPRDPYDDQVETADAPENLRYPERSFGPGKMPADTNIAQASGIANKASRLTAQSTQNFSPELVTNGGMFFSDVAPNEDENPNYTAF